MATKVPSAAKLKGLQERLNKNKLLLLKTLVRYCAPRASNSAPRKSSRSQNIWPT